MVYKTRNNHQPFLLALALFLIALGVACNPPVQINTPSFRLTDTILPVFTSTSSPAISYEQCGWNWATQPLPELSTTVKSALESAGLKQISVRAEAYGENCLSRENEVIYFVALETDYHISMYVDNLTDTTALGIILEQIMIVIDTFPLGSTPGHQLGSIGIRFFHESNEIHLWFSVTDGKTARAHDLHGTVLLEALSSK